MNNSSNETNTLVFEGAGITPQSDVANCRIRTRLKNSKGEVVYLEIAGQDNNRYMPQSIQSLPYQSVGRVDHAYLDNGLDQNKTSIPRVLKSHFEYTNNGILAFVNKMFGAQFTDLSIINDGSVRVHDTADCLC